MAMVFKSESIEVPVNMDREIVSIDLFESVATCPRHGDDWGQDETCMMCTDEDGRPAPEPAPARAVSLELSEDEAVELATLLLLGATNLRAERLAAMEY